MKRLLWAAALALSLFFVPSEAKAFVVGPYNVDTGAQLWCNVTQFNLTVPKAGPWYMYYPYQAYFQVPAPGVNPYFPPPMTLPPAYGQPPMQPAPPPQGYRPPMPTPAAYYAPAPQAYQAPQQGYYQQTSFPGYQPQMNPYFGR